MAVSKRLRFEVLRRDNHACRYCGASAPDAKLTVDHVTPVALGGSDDPTNLVTACADCNSGKSSSAGNAPMVDDIAADALRWARAMEEAARITRSALAERELFTSDWRSDWDDWTWDFGKRTYPLPSDWKESVLRFRDAGISVREFGCAVEIAMRKKTADKFPYMCGVLWNMLKERQEIAMQIVRGEESGKA